jgi:hypothetical protein
MSTVTPLPLRAALYRRARPRSIADCARDLHTALRALSAAHPACASWEALDAAYEPKRIRRLEDVTVLLEGAELPGGDGAREKLRFHKRFFTPREGAQRVEVLVSFSPEGDPEGPRWGLRVEVRIGRGIVEAAKDGTAALIEQIFAALVEAHAPDWALLRAVAPTAPAAGEVTAGWLTYRAGSAPAVPPPAPATVRGIGAIGHVIVAHPDPLPAGVAVQAEAIRAVQRYLDGALAPAEPLVLGPEIQASPWAAFARPDAPARRDATMVLLAFPELPALPFASGEAPSLELVKAMDAAASDDRARREPIGMDTTEEIPVGLFRGARAVTPWDKAPAPPDSNIPALTLEQYAALCAEMAMKPAQAEAILARYRLTGARRVVDEQFAQRFRAEPALQQRWQALIVHYGDWFRRQGTG